MEVFLPLPPPPTITSPLWWLLITSYLTTQATEDRVLLISSPRSVELLLAPGLLQVSAMDLHFLLIPVPSQTLSPIISTLQISPVWVRVIKLAKLSLPPLQLRATRSLKPSQRVRTLSRHRRSRLSLRLLRQSSLPPSRCLEPW